jgi:hypothetical protein
LAADPAEQKSPTVTPAFAGVTGENSSKAGYPIFSFRSEATKPPRAEFARHQGCFASRA